MSTSPVRSSQFLPTVIEQCRKRRSKLKLADSMGAKLTGGETLVRALVLRRVLRRHFLAENEQMIGIMLPPTVAGAIANLALALDRRVSVNLNFMLSRNALDQCIEQAALRHIITSRKPDDLPAFMMTICQAVKEISPALAGKR